jgi:hypothetical protein
MPLGVQILLCLANLSSSELKVHLKALDSGFELLNLNLVGFLIINERQLDFIPGVDPFLLALCEIFLYLFDLILEDLLLRI